MEIYRHTLTQDMNGCSAGTYAWFRTREEAESAALPGTTVLQTTPSPPLYRAKIAHHKAA